LFRYDLLYIISPYEEIDLTGQNFPDVVSQGFTINSTTVDIVYTSGQTRKGAGFLLYYEAGIGAIHYPTYPTEQNSKNLL